MSSSIFLQSLIPLDVAAIRTGLGWAQSWTKGPILCRIGEGQMRLIVVDQGSFLVCWSWPLPEGNADKCFFLIPSFVARTLSSPAAWDATALSVTLQNNVVGMIIKAQEQELRLQWRWSPKDFLAPIEFSVMSQLPDTMIRTPYVMLADVIHLAIANLVNPLVMDGNLRPGEQGILIDFLPGQINIDGEAITQGKQTRYYFNPRLVIRGLEIVRGHKVSFAMRDINRGKTSILYLANQRDNWEVHCAVLSIAASRETPAPGMTIRETRAPMTDGAWDLTRRR